MHTGQTIHDRSCTHPLAVFLACKRCCRSSTASEAMTIREFAHNQNNVLIVFPESRVDAPDKHLIRIDGEQFSIGANAHQTDSSVNRSSI